MKYRIGIVGGGQLGRMMTIPAKEMGFDVTVLETTPDCPAAQVGATHLQGSLTDEEAITQLVNSSDFITFEIEHINADILSRLSEKGSHIHPSPKTLSTIKDKLSQKHFLQKNGIPTAPFRELSRHSGEGAKGDQLQNQRAQSDSVQARMTMKEEIKKAAKKFGYPLLLKTRFGGYDGRGNVVITSEKEIEDGIKKLGNKDLYVEQFVRFTKELAVMVARSTTGDIKVYPTVETIHKNNILHLVLAPAPIEAVLQKEAQQFAIQVMEHLSGAGVFGIEMFLTDDKQILVNEIAPRVHNSGHLSIEACQTSQFEQHIRAITGLPLGETAMITPAAVMVNILGDRTGTAEVKGLDKTLALPGVSVHIYGKKETRPERKMGHITVIGKDLETCRTIALQAKKMINI